MTLSGCVIVAVVYCPPLSVANAEISTMNTVHGTTVVVICDLGYLYQGNLTVNVTCLETAVWSLYVTSCTGMFNLLLVT